ncbi:glycosyltransferase family 4 protein [Cronbergia sp. UHCC 0137]|uniref:glycosyltransferase family 4 protein n=1 Tax=Cronbergia sp. UHCC 0137 TaxID=3110239 RepID=UPI002B1F98B7|nr:glycosyltransferase family 4 protein [Cronbergia sp. UHCC 0137]MEA5620677.1 glycosyltransferase family 4 protein [Cronbergia sp. UHCC 0137]
MKIAIISIMGGFPWGGSEYLWTVTAEQALYEGHEVFISIYDWSLTHPLILQLQSQGAHLLPRPRFPAHLSPSLTARVIRKIKKKISFFDEPLPTSFYQSVFDCQPDVICISQGGSYDIIECPDLLNLLESNSIPYFIICQFNCEFALNDATRTIAQKFFTQALQVGFVSHHNLKLAERQLAKSLPNAVVVQNPVNLADHSLVPFPNHSTISFANVARLETFVKGQDILLEALSFPIWQERDWQCCLYGSGADLYYLENLAHHYKISDRIKFMGHINDVRSIWVENHLLVLASRGEGTPLALVEAMLCGRPAVVTNVGGNSEWIEELQTGFIAEAATARSISDALERAWLSQLDWQKMGIKAHKYATTKLDKSPGRHLLNMILDRKQTY